MISPANAWALFLRMIERQFSAAHPAPALPTPRPELVTFSEQSRNRHCAIYGLSGTGKSRMIEDLVMQQVEARMRGESRRGLMVIDVHDELFYNLRARIALKALEYPALYDLFIPIDLMNDEWMVQYDPLLCVGRQGAIDRANTLADVITTIYSDDPTVTVRLMRILRNSFLTLILTGHPFQDIFKLLGSDDYRKRRYAELKEIDTNLYYYWKDQFPEKDTDIRNYVESTLNRLEPMLLNRRLSRLFYSPATINFRKILDDGAIVLVNAPKGVLSPSTSHTICGLLLAEVAQAAMSRGDLPASERRPFVLFCDEFASYMTQTILTVITETRKYGLELIAASQEVVGQEKNAPLQRKVLKTVGTLACFRVGNEDALTIMGDLFTSVIDQVKHVREVWQKPYGIDTLYEEPVYRSLDEIREKKRAQIVSLPDRIFFLKQRGQSGTYLTRTNDMPDVSDLEAPSVLKNALLKLDNATRRRLVSSVIILPPPEPDADRPYDVDDGDK